MVLLYVGIIDVPWSKWDVCISGHKIWNKQDFRPLILSTIEHADDMHLYYNMISYLVKGRSLENKYGSSNFALILTIISLMTSGLYVILAVVGSILLGNNAIMSSCAIGFSGVIFALKFITTHEDSEGFRYIQGIRVPTKYATWVELIAIHILVPNASFMGHFAGVLAGILYTKTFLGTIIDALAYRITGNRIYHGNQPRYRSRSHQYQYNSNFYSTRNTFFSNLFGEPFGGYRSYYD
nr:rhomboid-related protein 4-like isoform X2 [Halyomorpha halys]